MLSVKEMSAPKINPEDALESHSIPQIADGMRNGRLSSRELTEAAINNHQLAPARSNAYIVWDSEQARKSADLADREIKAGRYHGALHGIPVSIKDIIGVNEYPVYAGGKFALQKKWQQEGPVIHALRSECCVFMGKTHTVQFAFGGLGVNRIHGTPINPYSDETNDRVSGGSSIGAGLSLYERSALIALGTDTAGSVRVPASFTNCFGLKTSKNRWSTDGIVPLCQRLDSPGILARRSTDLIAAFSTIDSRWKSYELLHNHVNDLQNQSIKLGICDNLLWTTATREIVETCERVLNSLAKYSDNEVVEVKFPEAQQAVDFRNGGGTASLELLNFLKAELPEWLDRLDPVVQDRISIADDIGMTEFEKRDRQLMEYASRTPDAFEQCDVIVSPTVPIPPLPLKAVEEIAEYRRLNLMTLQNTCIANILNLCAISIPIGFGSNGLPIGLQLMAPHGKDELLLAIAEKFEKRYLDKNHAP